MLRFFETVLPRIAAVGAFAISTAAFAQEGPGANAEVPAPKADAVPNDDELETILVTAQKRTENIQDVPLSVTRLDGEDLGFMRASGADIRVLSARIPSLTLESSFGRTFPRAYIRGLGNSDFDLNASQPVSIILDDVYLENPITKAFPLFDIGAVEVLRGPQGTLFGRNTTAGIIKFSTNRPDHDTGGYGKVTYGSFNFVSLEAASNASIVDQVLAVRASALFESRSGWVENTAFDDADDLERFDDLAARFQVLFTPIDELEVLLNVHGRTFSSNAGRVFRANIIQPGTDDLVDDFDRGEVSQDGGGDQELDQWGGSVRLNYDFGEVSLVSISGYEQIVDFTSRGDIDGGFGAEFLGNDDPAPIPFPSETADAIPDLVQFTQEIRLETNDWDVVNFQGGFFYFYEDLDIESIAFDTFSEGRPRTGFATQTQETNAYGFFASATVDLLDNLRLAGGVRYSDDSKDYAAVPASGSDEVTADPSADFWSWDASIRYQPIENVTLYSRVATSFRAPSIQGRLLFGDTISIGDREDIISFEAGVKTASWNNRLRFDFTGYMYIVDQQQLTAVGGAANDNRLINVDQSQGHGFELEVDLLPVSNLLLQFGVSLNNTEIVDESVGVEGCGAPCTVTDPAGPAPGTFSIDGNPLPNAPEWIVTGSLRFDQPVSETDEIFFFTDWAFRSRVNFFLYESLEFTDRTLVEGGARIGYSYDERFIEGAFFVRNITNNTSRTGGIDFNNLTGFVNEPFTWGIDLRSRF